jgi:Ca2+-binding RTX toxin-like protein
MQPKLLLPLAAAALVLTVPAAANAAVTTQINGNALTATGDAADDNVTIGVNNAGKLTHNLPGFNSNTDFDAATGGNQELDSNDTIAVTLNLGAGNDTANLSAANLANSTINGDAGDDIIVGGDNLDAINGGDDNDRITGFRGNDVVHGDAGNDVMIWNNGDGTDDNFGDAGADETLITAGTANDVMTVVQQGAITRFDRTNAPFGINMDTVERLNITSFSGDDSLATAAGVPLAMTIDAGSGNDAITTGDGADLVNGGDGDDALNGAGGGDRLVGDRGADTMNGGEGDDTTVWNNGDGSDVMNGENGVDRVETNLGAGPDVSTFKPFSGRVRYDRTSAGAFSLSIATAEFFELNSLGGDDTLTTSPGTGLPVVADGGAGNDVFNVREGERGHYFGGSGTDSATIDANDTTVDIETVVPPVIDPPAPGAGKLAKTAKVKKGVAAIKISCPAATAGCKGKVTLTYKNRRIGRTTYTLKAGETKTLKVKVSKKPSKRKPLTATARVSSQAGADKLTKLKLVL